MTSVGTRGGPGGLTCPPPPPACPQTSVLCEAAVHAGAVSDSQGGLADVSRERSLTLYESAFANGILSKMCVCWNRPMLAGGGVSLA